MLKKFFCVFFCLAMLFSFNACHNAEENNITSESIGEQGETYDNSQATDYINYETTTAVDITIVDEQTTNVSLNAVSTQKNTESTTRISTTKDIVTTSVVFESKVPSTTIKPPVTINKIPSTTYKTTTSTQVNLPEPSMSDTVAVCIHKNTILKNKIDATAESNGYTGDIYCADCGVLLNKGEGIEYVGSGVQEGMVQYPCPDGSFITVPVGTNVFDYTMEKAGKTASHDYYELEKEIFKLFNEERARLGISGVSNNEDAYYYVKQRAIEIQSEFSHTRPGGDNFSGVYEDEGIILCAMGENLVGHMTVQEGENIACRIFDSVMNSPAHKATALDSKYNQMAIAITYYDGQYYFCQHMYENVVH